MKKRNRLDIFLEKYWDSSNIKKGDLILLHANTSRLVRECLKIDKKFKSQLILQSLLEKIGPKGTIIVPTFTFKCIDNKFFDIKKSPSEMGLISELVRKNPKSIRTGHPVYSFSVLGDKMNLFRNINNKDAFSNESPFRLIHKLNCKIAIMDLADSKSMTFYHYIEQMNKIKYRFIKKFYCKYKGLDNKVDNKEYTIFVRDLKKKVITDVNRAGEYMWEKKIYSGDHPKFNSGIRVALAKDIYEIITKIIKRNEALKYLYNIKA